MTKVSIINNVVEVAVRRNISAWKPGQQRQDFESTASTWGQLKQELSRQGFSLSDVRVTEGNTQIDLVNDDALLPTNITRRGQITNDLVIIMTPQTKIKSGAVDPETASYKDMKAEIKDIFADNDAAKEHFGNYTQMSTANMRIYLASWYKKSGKSKPASPTKEVKEKPVTKAAKVVATSKQTKTETDKFNKVKENLEKKEFTHVETGFNQENYNEGLGHVLYGISLLQNGTFDKVEHDLPSDEDIQRMAKGLR